MAFSGVVRGQLGDLPLSPSYENAMEALSSLISSRKRGDGSKRSEKYDLMFRYLQRLGLEEQIDGLKIIHIAGTKGKGSTCTFCEAILRECGFRTGLFTSPHLIDVRERYRINGLDISKDRFLHHFWGCWHQLKEKIAEDLPMPPLFQFLTLLAFRIFLTEKVDVAILEVGLGGILDSTNVIKKPIVCGITSLGMDHMEILGDTLEKIASEKAGIFKPSVPAFTVSQLPEAISVLQHRAAMLTVPLGIAPPLHPEMLRGLELGLAGDHQFINAGLAVALCRCWLQQTKNQMFMENDNLEESLLEPFRCGLCTASLPGRAQIVDDKLEESEKMVNLNENFGNLTFYLDGAHSPESMEVCAKWFSNAVTKSHNSLKSAIVEEFRSNQNVPNGNKLSDGSHTRSTRILLFNCMEVREPQLLLPPLTKICATYGVHFSKAIFVPGMSTYHKVDSGTWVNVLGTSIDVSWQSTLQRAWEKIIHGKDDIDEHESKSEKPESLPSYAFLHEGTDKCNPLRNNFTCSAVIPSLPLAIKWLRECAKENPSFRLQVLVTGSLHLVGDVLKLLRR